MIKLITRRTHRKPSCRFTVVIRDYEVFDEFGDFAEIAVGQHQILKKQVRPPDDDILLMNWKLLCTR